MYDAMDKTVVGLEVTYFLMLIANLKKNGIQFNHINYL